MSVINNQDRKAIVQGMMKKTTFRQRFSEALKVVGNVLYQRQIEECKKQYGPLLIDYIQSIPSQFKGYLCEEKEGHDEYVRSHVTWANCPNLSRLLKREDGTPAWLLEHCRPYLLAVSYPSSIWLPKAPVVLEISQLEADEEGSAALQALELLASDYQATEISLAHFLSSIRTVKQLQDTMPEAMEFLPPKALPPAVIPDPSNALAQLFRAGFNTQAVAA